MQDLPMGSIAASASGILGGILFSHGQHATVLAVFSAASVVVGTVVLVSHITSRILVHYL